MDLLTLKSRLYKAWSKETAYRKDRDQWVQSNPSIGQCAITALVVNDYLGGAIVRGLSSTGVEHYWNVIDSKIVDLTYEQYSEGMDFDSNDVVDREFLLSSGDVNDRYNLLKKRLQEAT